MKLFRLPIVYFLRNIRILGFLHQIYFLKITIRPPNKEDLLTNKHRFLMDICSRIFGLDLDGFFKLLQTIRGRIFVDHILKDLQINKCDFLRIFKYLLITNSGYFKWFIARTFLTPIIGFDKYIIKRIFILIFKDFHICNKWIL